MNGAQCVSGYKDDSFCPKFENSRAWVVTEQKQPISVEWLAEGRAGTVSCLKPSLVVLCEDGENDERQEREEAWVR
jgi:hypothetical protein